MATVARLACVLFDGSEAAAIEARSDSCCISVLKVKKRTASTAMPTAVVSVRRENPMTMETLPRLLRRKARRDPRMAWQNCVKEGRMP